MDRLDQCAQISWQIFPLSSSSNPADGMLMLSIDVWRKQTSPFHRETPCWSENDFDTGWTIILLFKHCSDTFKTRKFTTRDTSECYVRLGYDTTAVSPWFRTCFGFDNSFRFPLLLCHVATTQKDCLQGRTPEVPDWNVFFFSQPRHCQDFLFSSPSTISVLIQHVQKASVCCIRWSTAH